MTSTETEFVEFEFVVGKHKRNDNYTSSIQIALDICKACDIDTDRVTSINISCTGIYDVATISVMPDQEDN